MERDQARGTSRINSHTRALQTEEVGESVGHNRHGIPRQLVHRTVLCVLVQVDLKVS